MSPLVDGQGGCDCGGCVDREPWVERVDMLLSLLVAAGVVVLLGGVAAGWWGQ